MFGNSQQIKVDFTSIINRYTKDKTKISTSTYPICSKYYILNQACDNP